MYLAVGARVAAIVTLRRYPMSGGKGEAQKDGRRGKIAIRIKPHTCQRFSECSNLVHIRRPLRD